MNVKRKGPVSRRQFLTIAAAASTTAMLTPRRLFAAERGIVEKMRADGATAKLSIQKLRGGISAILGSGGNIAILTGRDGKLLVDSGLAGSQPQIKSRLAQISGEPIKHLINTHWHFDHT